MVLGKYLMAEYLDPYGKSDDIKAVFGKWGHNIGNDPGPCSRPPGLSS